MSLILEGIGAAEEGAEVYRKADEKKMIVTGVACSWVDQYGNRKEEVLRFIELTTKATRSQSGVEVSSERPASQKASSS